LKPHTKVLALAIVRYLKGFAAAITIWIEAEEKDNLHSGDS